MFKALLKPRKQGGSAKIAATFLKYIKSTKFCFVAGRNEALGLNHVRACKQWGWLL